MAHLVFRRLCLHDHTDPTIRKALTYIHSATTPTERAEAFVLSISERKITYLSFDRKETTLRIVSWQEETMLNSKD